MAAPGNMLLPSENPEKRVLFRNSFLISLLMIKFSGLLIQTANHGQLGEIRNMPPQSLPLIVTLNPI